MCYSTGVPKYPSIFSSLETISKIGELYIQSRLYLYTEYVPCADDGSPSIDNSI